MDSCCSFKKYWVVSEVENVRRIRVMIESAICLVEFLEEWEGER